MTDTTEPLNQALDDHDITLALTPGQLVLLAIGIFVLLRVLRGLKR